jgi:putative phosphoesterase
MIGIISDVHGNYPALSAVLNELDNKNCEQIYCLGDICGYYCMINECIDLLRCKNVICLKGNHDSYLLEEQECPRSNAANYCIKYQQRVITKENYNWISGMNEMIITDVFCAVHGGWHNYLDEYIDEFYFNDELLKKYNSHIYISGHTHKQSIQINGNLIYCNPGSVGQPRDYQSTAAFMTIDDNKPQLHRVKYNIDCIAGIMKKSGFEEKYYANLYYGCKIGEKV